MANTLLSTQPYKGTRDFYPEDMELRNWFLGKVKEVLTLSAYDEYNAPMLESLDIYIAKSGEELAQQQTYNFENGAVESLIIKGRHDVCITLRAAVVIESAIAIALADLKLRA